MLLLTIFIISVISWWRKPVYLEKIPAASHLQTLSHKFVSSSPHHKIQSNCQM